MMIMIKTYHHNEDYDYDDYDDDDKDKEMYDDDGYDDDNDANCPLRGGWKPGEHWDGSEVEV